MLFTSGNVDWLIKSVRDVITYNRRSDTGISHDELDGNTTGFFISLFSLELISMSKVGFKFFSKLDCGICAFGNTRAGILSKIFGRFSCWALTESSNEYDGGSFQPGVYAK